MMDVPIFAASLGVPAALIAAMQWLHESPGGIGLPGRYGPPPAGLNLAVPGVDAVLDLHGDIVEPDLVVFFSGSQFVMAPELMRAFRAVFPRHVRVYFETLPPGILEQQIRTGVLDIGNLRVQIQPDVLACDQRRIHRLHQTDQWFDDLTPYLRNRLVLLVRAGNPRHIHSWQDLGRPDVRPCIPNPSFEGIGEDVLSILEQAGGGALRTRVIHDKLADGTTLLTTVHHRQAPLLLLQNRCDVAPIWLTEARLQADIGNPLEAVELPEQLSGPVTIVAGKFHDAPHIQAARDLLVFLRSTEAQQIYERHGFLPLEKGQIAQT